MILTQIQLEMACVAGCQMPGCTHEHHGTAKTIFMNAKCHMDAGLEVFYTSGSGTLKVSCRKCHSVIAEVSVATGEPPSCALSA
jgi:hypothetical protein